jgi:hypothetical protein
MLNDRQPSMTLDSRGRSRGRPPAPPPTIALPAELHATGPELALHVGDYEPQFDTRLGRNAPLCETEHDLQRLGSFKPPPPIISVDLERFTGQLQRVRTRAGDMSRDTSLSLSLDGRPFRRRSTDILRSRLT